MSRNSFCNLLLLFASILFALVLCEVGLRGLGFEYQLYPVRVEFGWPDPVRMKNEFEVDREMLWVPKEYDDSMVNLYGTRPSVVYMGDSCTAWGAYDQAFKKIIVEKHPNDRFSFVNVGVGGWSTFQGLRQMQTDIVRIKPSLVTIYYGWNDHWASFGVEDKNVARFNTDNPWSVTLSDLRLTQLLNSFAIDMYGAPNELRRPERVSPDDFRANLTAMVGIARDNGIVPVLFTAPTSHVRGAEPEYLASRWLNSLEELVPLHHQYVEIVRKVARDNDVLVLDLFEIFSRLPQEEVKSNYFVADGIHLTSSGSHVVGHFLYDFLEANDLIELIVSP